MPALFFVLSVALNAAQPTPEPVRRPVAVQVVTATVEPSPAPATVASPVPSIDSILQGQTDNESEDGAAAPPPASAPPPAVDSRVYDDTIMQLARSAQSRRGMFDGGWLIAAKDGRALYRFQLADGGGQTASALEGAWLNLRAATRAASAGFINTVSFDGLQLMLRFNESGPDDLTVVVVAPGVGGTWAGHVWRRGVATDVTFRRP